MENRRQDPYKLFKTTLHGAMGLLYVIIGVMVVTKQWFMFELQPLVAYGLGILAVAYGAFRCYRGYTLFKED